MDFRRRPGAPPAKKGRLRPAELRPSQVAYKEGCPSTLRALATRNIAEGFRAREAGGVGLTRGGVSARRVLAALRRELNCRYGTGESTRSLEAGKLRASDVERR